MIQLARSGVFKFKVVAIIPARGGSKGIPRKNIRNLAGKPLIAYTIEAAKKSRYINQIVVSTDDQEIAEISQSYGVEVPFLRPTELAADDTPMLLVVQHAVRFLEEKGTNIEIVVLLQPTSPLRSEQDIDRAIGKLLTTNADSVVSVSKVKKHPLWMVKLKEDRLIWFSENPLEVTRRQDLPELYALNGAVYVVRRDVLIKENSVYGKDIRAIVMNEEESVDIDTMFDLSIAEMIIKSRLT